MISPRKQYGLWFRMVGEDDAAFILSLRTDPVLAKHLSSTENDLEKQKAWIRKYKEREANGEEYYFLFEDEQHEPQGVVRLYDFNNGTFNCGSWIIKPGADEMTAIKSDIFISTFAIEELMFEKCIFEVRKGNKKVLRFHQKFSRVIGEDELHYYLETDRDAHFKKMDFLRRFLE